MDYPKSDLSYFTDPKNGSWYAMPFFPMTPISDAEFRVLFEAIAQMPMPYKLQVNYGAIKVNEQQMSRVQYLDFLYDQRKFYLNRISNCDVRIAFNLSEPYNKNGDVVDRRLVKCGGLMKQSGCSIYPFSTILRGTYSGFYGCGGIGGTAYFNGNVTAGDHRYKHNPDLILNRLLAMHWSATYMGTVPNVVRRQFLNKIKKVLKVKVSANYHDQKGKQQTAPVISLHYKREVMKDYFLGVLFDLNVENCVEYNVE